MSKNIKITLMAIIIVIFGNAIANAQQTHNLRIVHVKQDLYIVYNLDLCYKHYVFGNNEEEVKTNYYNNKSVGYNQVECITGKEV